MSTRLQLGAQVALIRERMFVATTFYPVTADMRYACDICLCPSRIEVSRGPSTRTGMPIGGCLCAFVRLGVGVSGNNLDEGMAAATDGGGGCKRWHRSL